MSENIQEKIINLLELSRNNPSEEEAASAAAMANKLMMRHNLSESELSRKSDVNYHGGGTFERDFWRLLASGCGQMVPVSFIYYSGTKATFRWVGTPLNCNIADELLKFWAYQVEQLYKIHLPRGLTKSKRAEFRKNFKRACAAGIIKRAREIKRAQIEAEGDKGTALVVVEDQLMQQVMDFLESKNPRVAKPMKIVTRTGYGTNEGFTAAQAVQMQKGVKDE